MFGFSRRSSSQIIARAFALSLCIVLLITSQPVAFIGGEAILAQSNNSERGLSRQSVPNYKMPNWNALLTEGKKTNRPELPRPPLKPPVDCGFNDVECREDKKAKGKIGQNLTPTATPANQIALEASPNPMPNAAAAQAPMSWRQRFGKWANALRNLAQRPSNTTAHSFVATETASHAAPGLSAAAAEPVLAAFAPPVFNSAIEAQTDPHYRLGGDGEDLFTGNYHWSLPLVSLPGRAGFDLNLTLHYNSLVWIKHSGAMYFDHDRYPTLTPGFRLGFPELDGAFGNLHGASTYVAIMPSGRRIELRNVATNAYEAIDSSHYYLTTAGATATLFSPDGTRFIYTMPAGNGVYRCTKIVDRNGNFITVNYANVGTTAAPLWAISTIVDTLGRTVTFNYTNYRLMSITQNWAGQMFYWAQFDYENRTINTNFSVPNAGPANGSSIPVVTRVITGDGARHTFVYNTWGQVEDIWTYGEADNQRAAIDYVFPGSATAQSDCPRFSQRNDYAANWGGASGNGWVSNYFAFDANETYGKVTLPNGVEYKEMFATTGAFRGLVNRTETREGSTLRQFTDYVWEGDGVATSFPPIRPRIVDTKVCDDRDGNGVYNSGTDKLRRTTVSYYAYGNVRLPEIIKEYNEGGGTVYRTRNLNYSLTATADYISNTRRIIGLVYRDRLFAGDHTTLVAQTDYLYDQDPDATMPAYLQDHATAASQHEGTTANAAYKNGVGKPRRGNLNKVLRYSVTGGTASAPITYCTAHNSTGTPFCTTDGISTHKTNIFYNDAFTAGVTTTPATPTWAYPTRVQDPDTFSTMVKYHYDHGGITEQIDPKAYATNNGTKSVTLYDSKGRVERTKVVKDGTDYSYTRNVYGNDHNYVQTFSTVRYSPAGNGQNATEEAVVLHLLDGLSRERITIGEHPGSTGGLKSQYVVYDLMGRVVQSSNPTEIHNSTWAPWGDDASGYKVSTQAYDWKGRPTVKTDQLGKTSTLTYAGCGCAGDNAITATDEMERKTKSYLDLFGRVYKTQTMTTNNIVYATTMTSFDVRDLVLNVTEYAGDTNSTTSQQTVLTYDGHGRLRTRKRPQETVATTFDYYDNDQLQHSKDARNAEGTLTYNNRGLLTMATYVTPGAVAATSSVTFGYDQNGKRTLMDDGPGQVTYQYDSLNRLTSETRRYDFIFNTTGKTFKLDYQYNPAGQLTMLADFATQSVNYVRDKVGQVTGITGSPFGGIPYYTTNKQYRAWGAPKTVTFGTGFSAAAKYTARMQVDEFDMPGVLGGKYTYNNDRQLSTFVAQVTRNNVLVDFDRRMDRTMGY
jgi:hypothetical protein